METRACLVFWAITESSEKLGAAVWARFSKLNRYRSSAVSRFSGRNPTMKPCHATRAAAHSHPLVSRVAPTTFHGGWAFFRERVLLSRRERNRLDTRASKMLGWELQFDGSQCDRYRGLCSQPLAMIQFGRIHDAVRAERQKQLVR